MNNMKNVDEDYVWDQSGEPDSEIQELERLLGTLRYQPRPLVIPDELQPDRSTHHSFGPRLAIAATIILAVGAAALWLALGKREAPDLVKRDTQPAAGAKSQQAAVTIPDDVKEEVRASNPGNVPVDRTGNRVDAHRANRYNRASFSRSANRRRVPEPQTPQLAAHELAEAEAGKAKLMMALRVASEKLNFALRKAQGTNNSNLIQNQHKIG